MGQRHHRYCNEKQIIISNQLQPALANANATIQNYAQQIAQLNTKIQQLTTANQQKDAVCANKDKKNAELNAQKEVAEKSQKSFMTENQKLIAENKKLKQEDQQIKERNQDLVEQVENLRYQLRNTNNETKDINAGLVAYFPFKHGSTIDATNHENDATVYGAKPAADRFDAGKNAFYFDGKSSIKGSATHFPRSERTIAIWFKPNTTKGIGTLFSYGGKTGQDGTSFQMNITNNNDKTYCEIRTGNGTQAVCQGEARLKQPNAKDSWNHFVASTNYNAGTRLYLNGELVSTRNNTFISDTHVLGTEFNIGGNFQGAIDEVRIYDRALAENEVRELYNLPTKKLKSNANNLTLFAQPQNKQTATTDNLLRDRLSLVS